jgi:aryl-alcohol dehydrogenase
MDGKFPIEKMIKFYDFADINKAAQESSAGIAIKPVLRMPAQP